MKQSYTSDAIPLQPAFNSAWPQASQPSASMATTFAKPSRMTSPFWLETQSRFSPLI